jgi:hypothetical protein
MSCVFNKCELRDEGKCRIIYINLCFSFEIFLSTPCHMGRAFFFFVHFISAELAKYKLMNVVVPVIVFMLMIPPLP